MKRTLRTFTWLAATAIASAADAQSSTTYEDGPDGVRYQVTRQVTQRAIPQTEIQSREQKVYTPQVTTEYQSYQQTYVTPVTQYQWTSHLRGAWNPFVQPYWTHELVPVTRWEARPATVQVPVAKTTWVEGTQTTQVPVTTYRTVAEEHVARVPISVSGPAAGGTVVASRPTVGGQQLQSDPPRAATSFSDPYRR